MYCQYCQQNINGTPCQSQSSANNCANTRGREPDYDDDDYRINQFCANNPPAQKQSVIPIFEIKD